MNIDTERQGNVATIRLAGRFDHGTHSQLRDVWRPLVTDVALVEVVLDFGGLDYIDSLSLGRLLVLREEAGKAGKRISLANCRGMVLRALEVATFHRLFTLR